MDNITSSMHMFDGTAQTTTGYSQTFIANDTNRTFQATGTTSAGSGASAIKIWFSNLTTKPTSTANDGEWVLAGTITLTLGTTKTGDGFATAAGWRWIRAEIDSISGTNASVDVFMGA